MPKSDSWRIAQWRLSLVRRCETMGKWVEKENKLTRTKATMKPTTARPNNPPITPPAMDSAFVPVAPVLTAPAETVAPALSSLVGVTSRKELRPPTGGGGWKINYLRDDLM